MSLKDTIRAAREEATANGNPFERTSDAKKGEDAEEATTTSQGFTRRSTSRAKPSRKAASGVRMVSAKGKPKSKNLSKEEAKAERKHEREIDDLRYNVTQQILEDRAEYQKARKVWRKFLIGGVAAMVLAFVQYMIVNNMGSNAPFALAVSALVTMVVAYVIIIVGMVYDWRRVRPLRQEANKYVQSMSEKRLITMINRGPKNKK